MLTRVSVLLQHHGYKHDPSRDRKKTSLLAKLDFTMSKIKTHTRRDWGTHAKELLLGCAYTFMCVFLLFSFRIP